jgi:hypothetical protein
MLTFYENVHEGPIGIGTRIQYSEVSLSAGNVISDGMIHLTSCAVQLLILCRTRLL